MRLNQMISASRVLQACALSAALPLAVGLCGCDLPQTDGPAAGFGLGGDPSDPSARPVQPTSNNSNPSDYRPDPAVQAELDRLRLQNLQQQRELDRTRDAEARRQGQ
ncbi:MAG: hypothetical protein AAF288_10405 [Planctomycetota bacterium]